MADTNYYDIATAVMGIVEPLPGWTDTTLVNLGTVNFAVRYTPQWVPALDKLPTVVIATREDLTEEIDELFMPNGLLQGYEIFVGICVDRRWDTASHEWRAARRREVVKALWKPLGLAAAVPEQWDVKFNPSPAMDHGWKTEEIRRQMVDSWMSFLIKVDVARSA